MILTGKVVAIFDLKAPILSIMTFKLYETEPKVASIDSGVDAGIACSKL